MTDFREGDRVRYIGPPSASTVNDVGLPDVVPGGLGWVIDEYYGGQRVVDWDGAATECVSDSHLEKVGDRSEPDPYKRIAGDPDGPKAGR